MHFNGKITDEGLKNFSNIYELRLRCNENITDEGFKYMSTIRKLSLRFSIHVQRVQKS